MFGLSTDEIVAYVVIGFWLLPIVLTLIFAKDEMMPYDRYSP